MTRIEFYNQLHAQWLPEEAPGEVLQYLLGYAGDHMFEEGYFETYATLEALENAVANALADDYEVVVLYDLDSQKKLAYEATISVAIKEPT